MMRLTRRRNGRLMTTIRVEHHVGREVVVDTIAGLYEDHADEPPLTRAAVERAVRDGYRGDGGGWDMTVGDLIEDLSDHGDQAREWAEEQMARLWPMWRA